MATAVELARLEAGAKGGTSGVKAFDQAQQQVRASRNEAVAAMNREAALIGAPAALTAGLGASIARPAALASANLSQLGAAAANMRDVDASGTRTYMDEARAALPVIDAYANRDLGQKIAELAASRAATGAGKALTDPQLRTQLLGYAESQRAQRRALAEKSYQSDLAHLRDVATGGPAAFAPDQLPQTAQAIGPMGPQGLLDANGNPVPMGKGPQAIPAAPQPLNTPAQQRTNFGNELAGQLAARQQALALLQNELAGPGITQEAIAAGQRVGIDPNRLYGLLTPQVEADYVAANRQRGLYRNPAAITTRKLILPDKEAAALAGTVDVPGITGPLPEGTVGHAIRTTFYDWKGNQALNDAFARWYKDPNNANAIRDATTLDEQRAAFEASPQAAGLATNYVADIIASARKAIAAGYGFDDFRRFALTNPDYRGRRAELALAFAKAKPLFDAASVVATRTVQPGNLNYPG